MFPYQDEEMRKKIMDHYSRKIEWEERNDRVSFKLMAAIYGMRA